MEETNAEQRVALLPADTLKQVGLEQFRLLGETESLKAFVDLCFLKNGKYPGDVGSWNWYREIVFVKGLKKDVLSMRVGTGRRWSRVEDAGRGTPPLASMVWKY
jgi:hypothetical protein